MGGACVCSERRARDLAPVDPRFNSGGPWRALKPEWMLRGKIMATGVCPQLPQEVVRIGLAPPQRNGDTVRNFIQVVEKLIGLAE